VSGDLRRAALAALAALLAACQAEQPTGIVVEVTSDLAGSDLEFHLRLLDRQGRPQNDIPFGPGDLPGRLNLVPGDAEETGPVTVEATVKVGTFDLSRRATVRFRPGAMVLLRLPLNAACVCVSCPMGRTCEERGLCADIEKDVSKLPLYAPRGRTDAAPGTVIALACTGDGGTPAPDAGGDLSPDRPDATGDGATAPDASASNDGGRPPDGAAPDVSAGVDAPLPAADAPLPMIDSGVDLSVPADLPAAMSDVAADLPPLAPDTAPLPADAGGRPRGAACTTSDQCLDGACVDGYCCSSACTAPCTACSNLKTGMANGQCAAALAGTDPDGDCAPDAPSTCLYDGMCDGAGACRLYGTTTLCAAATCGGATYTPERMCTGAGACAAAAQQSCGQFLCTMTGCPTTCQSHGACVSTAYCDGVACVPKKPALAACGAGFECLSGTCTIGLVCL